ncbi:hypothetical protein P152DRAFT_453627 [Eremomyces bilateralis CBS 781.70]|uniref:Uncharacterized protein n=1 Tax=Eremomyces bilateralis CBS 781.70 TaxID=1392243 RepID=A0A6G1GFY0_9PEZI|nr:uncharacterized protein P152DRAFT_453627 [Eremomyces bilateralis CBS 781.70]KAF1817015.1 hypothetical protein P152DRAFT_453627 [Eremomyces bilateralis CBS 781.70]
MSKDASTGRLSMASSLHPSDPSSSTTYSRHATPTSDQRGQSFGYDRSPTPSRLSASPSPGPPSREGTPLSSFGGNESRLGTLRRHRPRSTGGFLLPSLGKHTEPKGSGRISQVDSRRGSGKSNGKAPYPYPRASPRVTPEPPSAPHRHRDSTTSSRNTSTGQSAGMSEDLRESTKHQDQDDQEIQPVQDALFDPGRPTSATSSIDPMQLVHMALNLSETRRRTSHNSQFLTGGRNASGGFSPTPRAGIHQNYSGGNLRVHLQRQRQASQTFSAGSSSPTSIPLSIPGSPPTVVPLSDFAFSDATLKRAEKFRAYMELKVEHWRLLQFLPPLKSSSEAPGNSYYTSTGIPGSSNVDLKRVPSHSGKVHPLGREYNPMQLIRDRKLRNRSRIELRPTPEHWTDVVRVRYWIDTVQHAARQPDYRGGDNVRLPQYAEHGHPTSHGRTSGIGPGWKSRRQPDWTAEPSELLADAYWLEQDAHKAEIEKRNGNKIFPSFESDVAGQLPATESTSQVRPSLEVPRDPHRRRNSALSNTALSIKSTESEPSIPSDERDPDSNRGRRHKRRFLGKGSRDEGSGNNPLKQAWNMAARARSPSSSGLSSTDSEYEGKERKRRRRAPREGEENTAPLERFMAQQLRVSAAHLAPDQGTTALVSPGTPDKWGREGVKPSNEPQPSSSPTSPELAVMKTPPKQVGRQIPTIQLDQRQKSPSTGSSMDADRNNSTTPSSPLVQALSHNMAVISPASSRKQSPTRDKKFTRHLPKFGGELAKLVKRVDQESDDRSSRQASGERERSGSTSQGMGANGGIYPKSAIPVPVQKDDVPITGQMAPIGYRKRSKDEKEPGSSVSRFFRGRLGDIGRGNNKHDVNSDSHTNGEDESDTTEDDEVMKSKKTAIHTQSTSNLERRRETTMPRYRGELPTFRHLDVHSIREDMSEPSNPDHISAQKAAQSANRSPRLDRLKDDLGRIQTASSPELSKWPSEQAVDDSQFLDVDNAASRRLWKPTSRKDTNRASKSSARLAAVVGRGARTSSTGRVRPDRRSYTSHLSASRSRSRGGLSVNQDDTMYPRSHRHWSISQHSNRKASSIVSGNDANASITGEDEELETVDAKSIARIEALLLCAGIKARSLYLREVDVRGARAAPGRHDVEQEAMPEFLREAINGECISHNILGEMRQKFSEADVEELAPSNLRSIDESMQEAFTLAQHSQSHHQLVTIGCRTLSSSLNNLSLTLKQQGTLFQSQASSISTHLSSFRELTSDDLLPNTLLLSDTADNITGSLSRDLTLELRRVNERVERLIRMRRRRFRWVRRVGFVLLEWMLLGIMWWVWFVWVVLVKGSITVVRGVGRAILWCFWVD